MQGEAYKEAQRPIVRMVTSLSLSASYQMPTMVNSVVLNVTTAREGAGGRNPRDFWEDTFREADESEPKSKSERGREKQKDKAGERRAGEEEEEGSLPERIKRPW